MLPAPTAPSEGSAGVRQPDSVKPGDSTQPTADPGSPAQASLSTKPLPPRRSLADLLALATRRIARGFDPPGRPESQTVRWSAALLGLTSTASRFAPRDPKTAWSRVARQEDQLFRRLFPAGPGPLPKELANTCRRRSDLWSPAAPFLPLPALWGGRDRRPDHETDNAPRPESFQGKT